MRDDIQKKKERINTPLGNDQKQAKLDSYFVLNTNQS